PSTTFACACTSICTSSRSPLTLTVAITASTQFGTHFAGSLSRRFNSLSTDGSGDCACTRGAKDDVNRAISTPAAAAERHGGRRQFVGTPYASLINASSNAAAASTPTMRHTDNNHGGTIVRRTAWFSSTGPLQ